ncbi:hypothetical protein PVK06_017380 [Gossypium arboreum]|uniref:Uncharacterized protein n=1 Tax=Gossypium arboreum TaxID=29729 RepID=A0ABR0Q320_GOSAR|nr:hypothetical protein PVK06_017380 [Gossypium arboreum]
MVRAGKHGNCIGGRGRRSAFYLGSALTELLKLSREYQMLTVTKVIDFRWTRSQRVQSNSVTSLRFFYQSPGPCLTPYSVNRSLVDLIGPRTRESPAREECVVPWRFMGRALTARTTRLERARGASSDLLGLSKSKESSHSKLFDRHLLVLGLIRRTTLGPYSVSYPSLRIPGF